MTDMRRLMADGVAGARDMLAQAAQTFAQGNVKTDDEQLAEYEPMRGNAAALLTFTSQRIGIGPDLLEQAKKYEDAMEALWERKAGRP